MLRWFEYLGGVASESDLELRRQGRVVASVSMVGTTAAALLAVIYSALSSPADAWIGVIAAVGGLVVLGSWRATNSVRVVTNLTLTWLLLVFVGAALMTQALAYITWMAILPLVGFFIGGFRTGVGWTITVCLALLGTGVALMLLPLEFGVPGTPLVRTLRAASLPPVIAALGLFFELSRLHSAREMEAARAQALLASEAKGRLLAKVSHEIRTPLNGVLGLTQSLLLQKLPEQAQQDLQLIQQSGAGLLALINDLLDIARAEAGLLELHLGPVELNTVLRDVVALHQPAVADKPVRLSTEGLPDTPLWVRTDEVRLRQVLNNLVSNAVKFTDSGSVTVRLALGAVSQGLQEYTVAIEDTGRGISADGLERLYQPFTQLHSDLSHLGSGLGLSITKELAGRLGGTVSATSTLGAGSCFTLALALERCPAPRRAPVVTELSAFRALVVDDNALNRRVARALLERLGGTVFEAHDGQQALDSAERELFDVILMDLQMPVLDGLESTRRLLGRRCPTPIIGLTASAGPETVTECRNAGMVACLTKPVQLDALRSELARALARGGPGES